MNLIDVEILDKFCKKNIRAKKHIDSWRAIVEKADWKNTHDIKNTFQKADFIAKNKVIFNIRGNEFRLIVKVIFINGNIHIDWVGTHKEYDNLKL